jgi:hypothetical protein
MKDLTITVQVPDDFDGIEQTWEIEEAAQDYINNNFGSAEDES